ncbi:type II toxin-antitoxin system RelE/ParE family toxin [Novosphingobium colocasiae]|uniref:type II toxin-antitoxin system RelE family toxin n=1 Tax=Novosphingobium colocasiae TaxID=1256513 RepID=UPI0035B4D49E
MTICYRIVFRRKAKKAFDKLDPVLQRQIARKLAERATNPRVAADALSGMRDCYKIKLRASGLRLAYQVRDAEIVLLVLAVGRRDHEEVYRDAFAELTRTDD